MQQEIQSILDIARLAPSVHNTQPWLVRLTDAGAIVSIDEEYVLREGDPTGRQTIISLGIFCEAIRLVALEKGFKTTKLNYKNKQAILHLIRDDKKRVTVSRTIELLQKRSSDRSLYKPTVISPNMIEVIESVSKGLNARIEVVVEESLLQAIADLTSHGIGLALSNPSFRKELSHYLLLPWSRKKRGIAVKSLYIPNILAYLQPFLMRWGIGLGAEAKLERERWLSASAVIIISADGDFSQYWFDVGRAYLRASLAVEGMGLSQATSAAIVEASNYHEDVEDMLGTHQRILSVIRIGKGGVKRHYSPRVTPDDILTSS